jgi:hypothetical protein
MFDRALVEREAARVTKALEKISESKLVDSAWEEILEDKLATVHPSPEFVLAVPVDEVPAEKQPTPTTVHSVYLSSRVVGRSVVPAPTLAEITKYLQDLGFIARDEDEPKPRGVSTML